MKTLTIKTTESAALALSSFLHQYEGNKADGTNAQIFAAQLLNQLFDASQAGEDTQLIITISGV